MRQLRDLSQIPLSDRVFLTGPQVSARYGIGRNTLDQVAKAIGAKVKIGRLTRYKRQVFDDWANSLSDGSTDKMVSEPFDGNGGLKNGTNTDVDGTR